MYCCSDVIACHRQAQKLKSNIIDRYEHQFVSLLALAVLLIKTRTKWRCFEVKLSDPICSEGEVDTRLTEVLSTHAFYHQPYHMGRAYMLTSVSPDPKHEAPKSSQSIASALSELNGMLVSRPGTVQILCTSSSP